MNFFTFFIFAFVLLNTFSEISSRGFKPPPGRGVGPSGKPKDHFKDMNSRKNAEDAARNAGKGVFFFLYYLLYNYLFLKKEIRRFIINHINQDKNHIFILQIKMEKKGKKDNIIVIQKNSENKFNFIINEWLKNCF